jgi:signal transduction histidine kinase
MRTSARETAREAQPDEPAAGAALRPYTVLVVDDQPETLRLLTRLLEREGYEILCAPTGQEALSLLTDHRVHVMVVDYVLPDMTGAEVIEQSRALDDRVQIVLQTGYPSAFPPRELLRTLAIQGYHDKADGPEKLLHWIDVACRAYTVLERSRRSEHLKEQLVANVSHELRTPLNVILGYIQLMREGACGQLPEGAVEAVTTINRQALILLHLINDLLDMSKLQAGAMQIERECVCVSEIVDEFRDALPILIGEAPIELHWDVPPDVRGVADSRKVRVIVQNLISNAAKYTETGAITTRVRTDGRHTYVTVSDTGPGIHPDDHERIFELFEQARTRVTRREGGTGIGLYLARALSRLMGGDLTMESDLAAGSTFTLRLPAGS